MTVKLPNGFIDDLLSRVDIVEVIDKRVPLRKAGREFSACCPFHAEKTPSFTVSPQKQFFHCFGCGAHGSAIGFLMQYERLPFLEAVAVLASQVGLSLPEENAGKSHFDTADYELLEQVAQFFHQALVNADARVQSFLAQRSIASSSVQHFQLGYAPAGWSFLADRFPSESKRSLLIRNGLLIPSQKGGVHDRFRDRLIFPIRDQRGRVIAFGGRALHDEKPKYLNSPETPLFHKGRELFNIDQARKHVQPAPMLVVEGYMDALMLVQHGVQNVVASLGTAVTPVQLQRLFQATSELILCFDGDAAGERAAWRMLTQALPLMEKGREIKVIRLPAGEDPDSLVRVSGSGALLSLIAQAVSLSDFFFEKLLAQVDNLNEGGRARLVELADPLLSNLPDGVYRRLMYDRLSKYAMVDARSLQNTSGSASTPRVSHSRPRSPSSTPVISPLRTAITLLLQRPSLARNPALFAGLAESRERGMSFFLKIVDKFQQQPQLNCAGLLEQWRDTRAGGIVAELAAATLIVPEAGIESEFQDALGRLRAALVRQRIDELLAKAQLQPLNDEEQGRLQRLFREQSKAKHSAVEQEVDAVAHSGLAL